MPHPEDPSPGITIGRKHPHGGVELHLKLRRPGQGYNTKNTLELSKVNSSQDGEQTSKSDGSRRDEANHGREAFADVNNISVAKVSSLARRGMEEL